MLYGLNFQLLIVLFTCFCGYSILRLLTFSWSLLWQPDSFYFNILPFAEDVREFQFPSFSNLPSSMQPNEKQQEAADKLVQMLDLAPTGKQEILPPDFTTNPVLEVYCHAGCRISLYYLSLKLPFHLGHWLRASSAFFCEELPEYRNIIVKICSCQLVTVIVVISKLMH